MEIYSETYRIENLTFQYPNRKIPALDGISLNIAQGGFVALCGPSGSGKTTMLRHLKPTAAPHGKRSGTILFEGTPTENLRPKEAAAKIGFVLQSPENQIVTDKVWHELAFGLESLGTKQSEIRLRVAEMASFFGIQAWFHRSVTELSGGQKQILALASTMAMQPSVLVLDEPTGQLDPIAAGEFLAAVAKINRELGVTVVMTEHRLEEVFPLATQVVVMDKGSIIAEGTPQEVGESLNGQGHGMFLAMPVPMRIWAATDSKGPCPVTVKEGAAWLADQPVRTSDRLKDKPADTNKTGKPAVSMDNVWFKYEKTQPDVIKGLTFKADYGSISAILGGNGTGKTTALSLIAGINTPYRGKVHTDKRAYALPQNPQTLFTAKTVREELNGELRENPNEDLQEIVSLCRLEGLLDSHPYDLSGGEQQRTALAKVLLLEPEILLLDEPTKGLDAEYKQIFADILRKLASQQKTAIVIVSHDIEFCAEHADYCSLFFDGNIVTENTPREFFSGNSFYTTAANRMARKVLPKAISVKDVVGAVRQREWDGFFCAGAQKKASHSPRPRGGEHVWCREEDAFFGAQAQKKPSSSANETALYDTDMLNRRKLSKRTTIASAAIFLTIPLTILAGIYLLDDRQFYFISLLVLVQTMIPFALIFESRKPQARELVVIAVLCAIAVAGRAAFFMIPQFKPVAAVVIIAGVAFGGETGFLVGAMAAFISNMFFGQGPWTPWQMFAFGSMGFVAGVLFRRGAARRRPLILSAFGGFVTFFIYGGIMSPASVLMFQPSPTIEMFLIYYLRGIPFDLIHAAATVIFLALISRPMLEKLDRIKVKYGLVKGQS